MKDYIRKFVESVYPDEPDLALASFNERKCIEDATELIAAQATEGRRLQRIIEQQDVRNAQNLMMVGEVQARAENARRNQAARIAELEAQLADTAQAERFYNEYGPCK